MRPAAVTHSPRILGYPEGMWLVAEGSNDSLAIMKKTGNPVVLTINGKAEMIVQDAASYQRLLDRAERTEMMDFLRESRADMEAGRTKPAVEALEELFFP